MNQDNPATDQVYFENILSTFDQFASRANDLVNTDDFRQSSLLDMIMKSYPGLVFVCDLQTSSYIYVSENIYDTIGLDRNEFLTGGLQRALRQFPPSHNRVISQEIFPLMFGYFAKYCSMGLAQNIIVSYPSLVIHNDGVKSWYLHTVKVLKTDSQGRPQLLLKVLSDIQSIKKDNALDLMIVKKEADGRSTILLEKKFFADNSFDNLSGREYEILEAIGKSLTSEEIAGKLNISIHTVKVHRKNILKKLGAKGTAALVKFAVKGTIL